MRGRRPPDILRKSHAHTDGDARARAKREMAKEFDEAESGAGGGDDEKSAATGGRAATDPMAPDRAASDDET